MQPKCAAYRSRGPALLRKLILILILIGIMACETTRAEDRAVNVLGFRDNRSEQFGAGASVYVAKVQAVQVTSSEAGIKRLRVELAVERALMGPATDEIALAAWQHSAEPGTLRSSSGRSPWDGIDLRKGTLVLCVVASHGQDPVAGDIKDTKAAFEVHQLRSDADPIVKEFQDIVRIEQSAAGDIDKLLTAGISDLRWPIRRFALRTATRKANPDVAAKLVSEFLKQPSSKLNAEEIGVAVKSLYNLQKRQDLSSGQRVDSWMALAKLISSENLVVQDAAVKQFRWAVRGQPRPKEFDSIKAEMQGVLKPMAERKPDEKGVREAAMTILGWLDQPAAPLTIATTPTSAASLPSLPAGPSDVGWRLDAYQALSYRIDCSAEDGETLKCLLRITPGKGGTAQVVVEADRYKYTPPSGQAAGLLADVKSGQTLTATLGPTGIIADKKEAKALSQILEALTLPVVQQGAKDGDKTESIQRMTSQGVVLHETREEVVVVSATKDSIRLSQAIRASITDPSAQMIHRRLETRQIDFSKAAGLVKSIVAVSQMADQPVKQSRAEGANEAASGSVKPKTVRLRITLVKAEPLAQ